MLGINYLKILIKDSILVNHSIGSTNIEETLESNDQDIIFQIENRVRWRESDGEERRKKEKKKSN